MASKEQCFTDHLSDLEILIDSENNLEHSRNIISNQNANVSAALLHLEGINSELGVIKSEDDNPVRDPFVSATEHNIDGIHGSDQRCVLESDVALRQRDCDGSSAIAAECNDDRSCDLDNEVALPQRGVENAFEVPEITPVYSFKSSAANLEESSHTEHQNDEGNDEDFSVIRIFSNVNALQIGNSGGDFDESELTQSVKEELSQSAESLIERVVTSGSFGLHEDVVDCDESFLISNSSLGEDSKANINAVDPVICESNCSKLGCPSEDPKNRLGLVTDLPRPVQEEEENLIDLFSFDNKPSSTFRVEERVSSVCRDDSGISPSDAALTRTQNDAEKDLLGSCLQDEHSLADSFQSFDVLQHENAILSLLSESASHISQEQLVSVEENLLATEICEESCTNSLICAPKITSDFILNLEIESSNSFSGDFMALSTVFGEDHSLATLSISQESETSSEGKEFLEVQVTNNIVILPESVDAQGANNIVAASALPNNEKEDDSLGLPSVTLAILPTISEKSATEDEEDIPEEFEGIDFNLQNSPMLRRSRKTNEESMRRDCRFIFNENFISNNRCDDPSNQKQFVALRDSLDITKHVQLLEESDADLLNEDSLSESESSDCSESTNDKTSSNAILEASPIPCKPFYHVSPKAVTSKKKTSMKRENESGRRRVSFPDDDSHLITSYLEPVNPWYHMNDVSTDIISEAYKESCAKHKTRALPIILQQIAALPVGVGGRIECLNIRNYKLDACQCECLEEIFRRVQFHTLDFEGCELDDDTAIPLFDMIEFYDSAVQLNISCNNKIGCRGWQACARMMKRTPSLRMLEARNTNLSEQNMPIICKALRLGTRLHTLRLENCNLTGRLLVNLAGALRLNDTITDLYLADNRLGANDCIQIGNLVRANKVLKLLDLRNNNIQDAGCAHICKDIAEQQNFDRTKNEEGEECTSTKAGLSTLVLWNNHITVNAVPHFSMMLYSNVTLETLNLGRNNLTSEGVLLLKCSLMRNRSLKRIGLQATRIGNEGAVALAECIADNNVISRIDLRENSIQVAGLLALSRSLKINSTVVQLDLDANPRAEPSSDLSEQHTHLHREIKSLCQQNQTNDHLKQVSESKKETKRSHVESLSLPSSEGRKISLTCETTNKVPEESTIPEASVNESKRYRSPAPSPSVSPCPSPSLSPSPSPVPSPLKNRFKVCKVSEEIANYPSNFMLSSSSSSSNVLSTSAPAFLMHSTMSSSLPSLVSSTRPNRFTKGGGGRFTVTKVPEINKSSLPNSRAMSSPSLIVTADAEVAAVAPTIVVSSPNKAVHGFNVEASESGVYYSANLDRAVISRNGSLDLPVATRSQSSNSSPSSDSSSPQDDVFIEESVGPADSNSSPLQAASESEAIQRAPLASIEAGSFDSDSEDSEVTTQSSDSTHSDEVRISAEQTTGPLPAWEAKKNDVPNSNDPSVKIKDPFVKDT